MTASVSSYSLTSPTDDTPDGFRSNGPDIAVALQKMGVVLPRDENMEKTEELCQNLLIILFTIMWKGVDKSDQPSWKVDLSS